MFAATFKALTQYDYSGLAAAVTQAFRRMFYFGLDARVELYHLLAGLSRAGQALPAAIASIAMEQLRCGRLQGKALYAIQRTLKSGKSFEQSFRPWIPFDELTILAAADRNAATEAFSSLATISSALREIKGALMSAAAYPLLLTVAAFFSMRGLYYDFVVPSAKVMDVKSLPVFTQRWMDVVTFCAEHPFMILAGAFLIAALTAFAMPRLTGPLRRLLDRYAPPFLIYREVSAARFLLAFVGLQIAKTPVAESLKLLTSNASPYMRSHLEPMYRQARSGKADVSTFRSGLLDPSVSVTLALLLSTQDAETALPRIAETLLSATQRRVEKLARLIAAGGMLIIGAFAASTLIAFNDFGAAAANISNAANVSP